MPKSTLVVPGPQQMLRGALPIWPRGASTKAVGSKKYSPDVSGDMRRNGATWLGSPGDSKSKLFISSRSLLDVMRMGKPDCKVVIVLKAHPLETWRSQLALCQSGSRQYALTTRRCGALKSE